MLVYSPAVEADDNMTVWNHIGKKYMMEKLQNATRKLLIPTSTGIFCLSRNGASTGSTASFSSTTKKTKKNTTAATRVEITRASSHCPMFENNHRQQTNFTYRQLFVIAITQEEQGRKDLGRSC